jgi:hypothetical protein
VVSKRVRICRCGLDILLRLRMGAWLRPQKDYWSNPVLCELTAGGYSETEVSSDAIEHMPQSPKGDDAVDRDGITEWGLRICALADGNDIETVGKCKVGDRVGCDDIGAACMA